MVFPRGPSPMIAPMKLDRLYNTADFREAARRRLPAPMFSYIDGGADDEWTLKRNTAAFDDYEITPSQLNDISAVDTGIELFGRKLDWPVFLAPTAMTRLFHHEGERAAARAADATGTLYSVSTLATTSMEDIAAATPGPKMFQVYIFRDRGLTAEFVERAKASGYDALCLTVDTPVQGNRERDLKTGMTIPPRFSLKSALSFAAHPHWALTTGFGGFELENVSHGGGGLSGKTMSLLQYIHTQFDSTLTWKDAEWLRERWDGPFVIKGLQSAADVARAAQLGADAVMISNHGGRQLDSAPAPVDGIAAAVEAADGRLDVICDGGIRRGKHAVIALALGAKACSVGRAYLYGLAAAGEAGATRALTRLKEEVARTMALMGKTDIAGLSPGDVERL